jgi:hypothetical protein
MTPSATERRWLRTAAGLRLRNELILIDEPGFAPPDDTVSSCCLASWRAASERCSLGLSQPTGPSRSGGHFLPVQTTAVSLLDRLLHHAVVSVSMNNELTASCPPSRRSACRCRCGSSSGAGIETESGRSARATGRSQCGHTAPGPSRRQKTHKSLHATPTPESGHAVPGSRGYYRQIVVSEGTRQWHFAGTPGSAKTWELCQAVAPARAPRVRAIVRRSGRQQSDTGPGM